MMSICFVKSICLCFSLAFKFKSLIRLVIKITAKHLQLVDLWRFCSFRAINNFNKWLLWDLNLWQLLSECLNIAWFHELFPRFGFVRHLCFHVPCLFLFKPRVIHHFSQRRWRRMCHPAHVALTLPANQLWLIRFQQRTTGQGGDLGMLRPRSRPRTRTVLLGGGGLPSWACFPRDPGPDKLRTRPEEGDWGHSHAPEFVSVYILFFMSRCEDFGFFSSSWRWDIVPEVLKVCTQECVLHLNLWRSCWRWMSPLLEERVVSICMSSSVSWVLSLPPAGHLLGCVRWFSHQSVGGSADWLH